MACGACEYTDSVHTAIQIGIGTFKTQRQYRESRGVQLRIRSTGTFQLTYPSKLPAVVELIHWIRGTVPEMLNLPDKFEPEITQVWDHCLYEPPFGARW